MNRSRNPGPLAWKLRVAEFPRSRGVGESGVPGAAVSTLGNSATFGGRKPLEGPLSAGRHGAVLAMTLVCLLVVGSLGVLLLQSALHEVQQSRVREHQLQALWLVQSGLERGLARLAASTEYSGETWQIPADDLSGQDAATIHIRVEEVEDLPAARRVAVEAIYPDESLHRIVQRRTIRVALLSPGEEP